MFSVNYLGRVGIISDETISEEKRGKICDAVLKILDEDDTEEYPLPDKNGLLDAEQDGEECGISVYETSALYVSGEDFNEVHAIFYDDDYLIKKFEGDDGEKAGAYIEKLAGYTDLKEISPNGLYVAPGAVTCVTVDDGGNDDYEVNVVIGKRKLLAAKSGDIHYAFGRKREIEKLLGK